MIIYKLEDGVTANYATDEMKKHIKEMCGEEVVVKYENPAEDDIVLATFDTLGINADDIEDKKFDDAFDYLARCEDEYALYFEYFLYLKRIRFMFGLAADIWSALD